MNDEPRGILEGVRVLDMSFGMAGAVAAMLLAELGADAIKIEPPGGDPFRALPGFRTWNRSKRGVVLDLHRAADREALDRLLEGADVLIHGLRPSVARRHGLDEGALSARFPALVHCSVLGWPAGHPDAERPGYEALVAARMGLMDEQRGHRAGPVFYRLPVASCGAMHLAVIGILARLHVRERSGRGGPVHTSLLQGALAPLNQYWARAEKPNAAFVWNLPKNMLSGLWEAGDGLWFHLIGPVENVPLMVQAMAELSDDEVAAARRELDERGLVGAAYQADPARLMAAFKHRDRETWLAALRAADLGVSEANQPGEVFADAQVRANGYVQLVLDPEVGPVWQAATPIHVDPPPRVRGPAPRLGEHTREVLAEKRAATRVAPGGRPIPRVHPLEGLRVLDLGNFLAGPFGPMLLADLGAEVIKLEATTGDRMRMGVAVRSFTGCQRGKRGIAVDLRRPESRPVLERLVRWADVVHHNLRYPAARKLGVDYDSLRAIKPDLIYCHCSGYGPVGERKDWPSYDQMFQACSGWEVAGGGEGNPPIWHRVGMMDHQNAMISVEAVLLALRERERTGRGQFVRSSLLGGSVLTMSEMYVHADGRPSEFPWLDRDQMGIAPGYRMYEVADGHVVVAALGPGQLESLRRVAGVERDSELEHALRPRKLGELLRSFELAGVPAEEVRREQEDAFFDSPEHVALKLAVQYPHIELGRHEQVGAMWSFGDLEPSFPRAAPGLGQHTLEIMRELGFSADETERLIALGAIAPDARHAEPSPLEAARR
jgi:crotonobetainyl-CoA:carnitine CoA-transferase CaiB-like acyl-CoA transferase